jgi:hypothetical protein
MAANSARVSLAQALGLGPLLGYPDRAVRPAPMLTLLQFGRLLVQLDRPKVRRQLAALASAARSRALVAGRCGSSAAPTVPSPSSSTRSAGSIACAANRHRRSSTSSPVSPSEGTAIASPTVSEPADPWARPPKRGNQPEAWQAWHSGGLVRAGSVPPRARIGLGTGRPTGSAGSGCATWVGSSWP